MPSPPQIIVPETVPPLRIGISDSASAFEQLARDAYSQDSVEAELHFIAGNDQRLLADLEVGQLDAVLVYNARESATRWIEPVALDGLIILTHPEIQLPDIGLQALKPIYSEIVSNWSMFDLPANPIILIGRESGSGAYDVFDTLVMGGVPVSPNSLIAVNEPDMTELVARTPGAIAYGMMGSSGEASTIAVDELLASPLTTTDGSYPLITPIYFVARTAPSGDLQTFLSNMLSDSGQAIIGEKYGRLR